MVLPARSLILAPLVAIALGCAIEIERVGTERLLEPSFQWILGEADAEEVARDLGLPEEIHSDEQGLRFVYRLKRSFRTSFVLSYMLRFLTAKSEESEERTLVLFFDWNERLLDYHLGAPFAADHSGEPLGR